jgi:hypothetical protein
MSLLLFPALFCLIPVNKLKNFLQLDVFICFGRFNLSGLPDIILYPAYYPAPLFLRGAMYEVPVDTYSISIFEINLLWAFFHNLLDIRE